MSFCAAAANLFALASAVVTAVPPGSPALPAPQGALGTWSNPKGSLAVRTQPCAGGLCGAIVWANAKALADAREAGVNNLIGTQLLQNYRPAGRKSWTGRVFVPDMGHSFPSHIVQTGPDQLTISGCLIGGFFCRSQIWRRIG